jgi:hypothetical protein
VVGRKVGDLALEKNIIVAKSKKMKIVSYLKRSSKEGFG